MSSPFALAGFDYEADGYWANTWHEPKDVVPNKGVVTVVIEDETFTGDIAVDLDEDAEAIVPDPDPEDPPALLPDSPFYFLKRFVENVRIFFTFNEENKDELRADLAEERARELAALEQKYIDEELTEKEIEMFTKLAEELKEYSEGFLDRFADLDEEELESLELTEEEVAKVEKAMDNLGEALDWLGDGKDDDDEEDEGNYDKYLRRIEHLKQVQERSNGLGLERAIQNAYRQRERWLARNGMLDDEEEPEEEQEEGTEAPDEDEELTEADETTETAEGNEELNDKDKKEKNTPPGQLKKEDREKNTPPGHSIRDAVRNNNGNNGNKGNNGNNGNNKNKNR
ncbi:MAG: hypothetical protein FH749_04720 [Firmicutes bacterium]|nr:hypothetical protein [Bacillota bacterium]